MINRRGRTAFHLCHGKRDLARNADATPDTIYRIYSMTKPLTAVAAMMLYEEGRFQLDDPITRYLPEFAGQRVFTGGGYGAVMTEPAIRDITFRDLLTHTSGLTYGFMQATPVDAIYRAQKLELPGSEEPLERHHGAACKGAAYRAARRGMELLDRQRCARPSYRRHLRPAVRRVPARARHSSARHDRYRLLRVRPTRFAASRPTTTRGRTAGRG